MTNILSKGNIFQLIKYGISGGVGAVIDFSLYTLIITTTQLNFLIANFISFSLGTIVVYYFQKNWTFQYNKKPQDYVITKFISVVIITFILNNIILIICVNFLLINPISSKIIQIIISFFWGYSINKIFVFKVKDDDS
jgi:putative flippase GtrA